MFVAYKLEASNPNRHPNKSPLLVWQFIYILEAESQSYFNNGFQVTDQTAYNSYVDSKSTELNDWLKYEYDNRVKVMDYVEQTFEHLPYSNIDFTIHLRANINFIKKKEYAQNGRPISAKYYYPTVSPENLIAQIDFEFIDNAMKFMISRIEKLKYFKNNGEFVGPFEIHKRTYDFNDLSESTESIQERSLSRRNIIDEIKVFLNGFIIRRAMLMGKSQLDANIEAMTIGGTFMRLKNDIITSFIETASADLKTFLTNQAATGNYEFLDWQIQAGLRVRDYFITRISY